MFPTYLSISLCNPKIPKKEACIITYTINNKCPRALDILRTDFVVFYGTKEIDIDASSSQFFSKGIHMLKFIISDKQ